MAHPATGDDRVPPAEPGARAGVEESSSEGPEPEPDTGNGALLARLASIALLPTIGTAIALFCFVLFTRSGDGQLAPGALLWGGTLAILASGTLLQLVWVTRETRGIIGSVERLVRAIDDADAAALRSLHRRPDWEIGLLYRRVRSLLSTRAEANEEYRTLLHAHRQVEAAASVLDRIATPESPGDASSFTGFLGPIGSSLRSLMERLDRREAMIASRVGALRRAVTGVAEDVSAAATQFEGAFMGLLEVVASLKDTRQSVPQLEKELERAGHARSREMAARLGERIDESLEKLGAVSSRLEASATETRRLAAKGELLSRAAEHVTTLGAAAIIFVPLALGLSSPRAQAAESTVDYILIERLPQSYVGVRPQQNQDWVLPGGACVTIRGPGGVGGNPQRHSQQLTAIGWSNGPNGVKQWGEGDDIAIGPVAATWSTESIANEAHSGSWCLTDSPDGTSSGDTSAKIDGIFDLTAAGAATLDFWHHWQGAYAFTGSVFHVEARFGIGDWQTLEEYRYFGGIHGSYIHEQIDLAAALGQLNVELRFRADAGGSGNGWTIDDILLIADGEVLFADDFESGTDGWTLEGTWGLTGDITDTPYASGDTLGSDVFGSPVVSVDAGGLVSSAPVGLPTAWREGMGYAWVKAISGTHADAVFVYATAITYIPE